MWRLKRDYFWPHIAVPTRETISRSLKNLKTQGLVEQRGRTLIVTNLKALEAYEQRG
jgi:CRP-like cAMP-binding protein